MTRFEAIKQGHIKIVDISIVCNFTVDKCELNPAYVIKNIDSPKDLLNGQKKRSSSENRISYLLLQTGLFSNRRFGHLVDGRS